MSDVNASPPRENLIRAILPGYELRKDEEGAMPTLVSRFAVFNEWTEIDSWFEGRFMERIAPGAFKKTMRENRDSIKVLFDHGHDPSIGNKVLGKIADLREDADAAVLEAPLFDTSYNRDLLPGLEAGQYGASFRFQVVKEEIDESPKPSETNPHGIPERTIKEIRLFEAGPVTFPAYASATAGVRSLTGDLILGRLDPERLQMLLDAQERDRVVIETEPAEGRDESCEDCSEDECACDTQTSAEETSDDVTEPGDEDVAVTDDRSEPALPEVEPLSEHSDDESRADEVAPEGDTTPDIQEIDHLMKYGTIEEQRGRLDEIAARCLEIDTEFAGASLPAEAQSEWDSLRAERLILEANIKAAEERKAELVSFGARPGNTEEPAGPSFNVGVRTDPFDLTQYRSSANDPHGIARAMGDGARRVIERATFEHPGARREDSQEHVDRLLERDKTGELARLILTTGSPLYKRAFGKALVGKPLSDDEQRALSSSDGGGGYAVPFTLDPTVIPVSNGAVNPLRAISRVETITNDEWKGVTASGITPVYEAEASEAADAAPTLTQPTCRPVKAHTVIPYSVEIGGDWGGLLSEMSVLLADGKDELEAEKFANGSGSNEPQGIFEYLDDSGQSASWVDSNTYNAFTVPEDLFLLDEALPPRHRPLARFVANKRVYNLVRAQSENDTYWARLGEGQPGQLIGYPAHELSTVAGTTDAGDFPLLFGDFRKFLIVDRVGLTVELIPHLFHTGNNLPYGTRALYAWWRNNSTVLDVNAFRLLRIEPSS